MMLRESHSSPGSIEWHSKSGWAHPHPSAIFLRNVDLFLNIRSSGMDEKRTLGSQNRDALRPSPLARGFLAIRKSFHDDGLIGGVIGSPTYLTVRDARLIWVILVLLLWVVEDLFGLYLVTDPLDRLLRKQFDEPSRYGPLGEALQSNSFRQLDRVLTIWWLFDVVLWVCFKILDKYATEPHESAEREYKESLKQLGDPGEDEYRNSSRLAPIVDTKAFRYLTRAVLGWAAISMTINAGRGVYDEVQMASNAMPEVTEADLARINPYRDLLLSQDKVLRDRKFTRFMKILLRNLANRPPVIYIKHVLRDLTPTTLPEDDYQLYSDLLRSLETRTDISWRVYDETDIRNPIMAASNRYGDGKSPMITEPFFIKERLAALYKHWDALDLSPDRPQAWETVSDTTFLKPIIQGRPLKGGEADKHPDTQQSSMSDWTSGLFELSLTPDQEAEATRIYAQWRRKRDYRASYLKLHPPRPIAWVPVSRSDVGARKAWGTLFDDWATLAGRRVPDSRLVGNKEWKPIFMSAELELVPFSWVAPGGQARTEEDLEREIATMDAMNNKRAERRTKQFAYLQELKEKLKQEEEKKEL